MYTKIYDKPEIYQIYVPLPNNPLKNLNCYVVKTDQGNLVIDTGFNQIECLEALKAGLDELQIDMDYSVLYLTHFHADHSGLTCSIATDKTKVYMHRLDYAFLTRYLNGDQWEWNEAKFLREGFAREEIYLLREMNQARVWAPDYLFDAEAIDDGYTFKIGEYEFECIFTPGHTPGHSCLYFKSEKIMFLGDHVLFDITPNITMWRDVENSLADYLESLERIKTYDMKLALPAHRKNEMDVYERIEQIKEHHKTRLQETLDIVKAEEGLTATEIGSRLKWSMRGKRWDEFPVQQKWFAVGETISHLDFLRLEGKIIREKARDDRHRYYLA